MNAGMLSMLGAVLVMGATTAKAQTETLTYTGGLVTGTLEVEQDVNNIAVSSSSSAYSGNITASLLLSTPLPLFGTTTVQPVGGFIGAPIDGAPIPADLSQYDVPAFALPSVSITTYNGAIVGWNLNTSYQGGCYCYDSFSMSNMGGDSFSASLDMTPDSGGNGTQFSFSGVGPSGSWTVSEAPEIDPTAAVSGLALLAGGLVVVGRRRQRIAA
jgi:hypothetical protein